MSIHADDEFSLKIAVESELDGVLPRDGLAALIIARYRRAVRRRIAGAVGLVVTFAGIGIPLGLTSSSGSSAARSSPIMLRIASYALTLPGLYRLSSTKTSSCAAAVPAIRAARARAADNAVAAASPDACVVLLLSPPTGDPDIPEGAQPVTAGRYRAWLIPSGYWQADTGAGLIIQGTAPGDRIQDLVISASGLSQAALLALVGPGLRG